MPRTVTITTEVYCTLQLEGLHFWPSCDISEVDYLKSPHRHLFHFKAYKKVTHADRDVEFIVLKHKIQEYLTVTYYDVDRHILRFGTQSCEMIAKELITKFNLSRCEVSEDGENGAIVTVGEELVKHELHG